MMLLRNSVVKLLSDVADLTIIILTNLESH